MGARIQERFMKFAVCALALGIVASFAPMASAQDTTPVDAQGLEVLGDTWLISTAATTTSLVAAYGIYSLKLGVRDSRVLRAYLQRNAVAVQHDLHVPGGEVSRELAVIFGVAPEQSEAFGKLLHRHRAKLEQLIAPGPVDLEDASQFIDIVTAAMEQEEISAPASTVVSP